MNLHVCASWQRCRASSIQTLWSRSNFYSPVNDCWLDDCWLLSVSSLGSTKFSGLGSGHVLDRARICGSNAPSWSSANESIWSLDNPSNTGGDGHGSLNVSIFFSISFLFYFKNEYLSPSGTNHSRRDGESRNPWELFMLFDFPLTALVFSNNSFHKL